MRFRTVRWRGSSRGHARALPEQARSELHDILLELSAGPIPPRIAHLRDPYVPDAYEIYSEAFVLKVGLYEDEIWVWVVRPYR